MWFKIGIVKRQPAAEPARSAAYSAPVWEGNRVSATQTTIPPKTNGIAMRVNARAVQANSLSGSAGIYSCTAKHTAIVRAKRSPLFEKVACAFRGVRPSPTIPPATTPNIASGHLLDAELI